jgi:mannose-6-phosphate isomerase-like protein (cupin superfamily)
MIGYKFYNVSEKIIYESKPYDLYQYKVFIGNHSIKTNTKSSYWYINENKVISKTGENEIFESNKMCVELFGYTPETRTSTYDRLSDLPYINGCSTKQLINPNRLGDPTWQLLYIPPYSAEQAHHVHSTARVVYVHQGKGKSHIGQDKQIKSYDLTPGTVVILDKMIPHHFSTEEEGLIVLPIHIFSSTSLENHHPMFAGTHKV